jgi:phage FluMu protein Com
MPRKIEKDEFGCEISFKVSLEKKCPTCRRIVSPTEIAYIKEQFKKHPEVDDHAY